MTGQLLKTLYTLKGTKHLLTMNESVPLHKMCLLRGFILAISKAQMSTDCIGTSLLSESHIRIVSARFFTGPFSRAQFLFVLGKKLHRGQNKDMPRWKAHFFKGYKCWQNICVLLLSSPWLSFIVFGVLTAKEQIQLHFHVAFAFR